MLPIVHRVPGVRFGAIASRPVFLRKDKKLRARLAVRTNPRASGIMAPHLSL
jgi:hypothetical protein